MKPLLAVYYIDLVRILRQLKQVYIFKIHILFYRQSTYWTAGSSLTSVAVRTVLLAGIFPFLYAMW